MVSGGKHMSKPNYSGIPKIHPLRIGGDGIFSGGYFEDYLLGQGDEPDLRVIPNFERAALVSIGKQSNGFPHEPNAGIKHVLSVVRRHIPFEERHLVKVFSTIKRPLDSHGVDCFFYYRGKVVLVDVTRNPRKFLVRSHLVLTDDIVGCDQKTKVFSIDVVKMLISDTQYSLPLNICLWINKTYCGY